MYLPSSKWLVKICVFFSVLFNVSLYNGYWFTVALFFYAGWLTKLFLWKFILLLLLLLLSAFARYSYKRAVNT